MIPPVSYETAWVEAERRAYNVLVGCVRSEDRRDAFLGRNPGIANAWHFESLPLQGKGNEPLLAPDVHAVHLPYRAECVFLKRELCMIWAMRIIGGLPLIQDVESNVATFRVTAVGDILSGNMQFANEKATVDVWRLEMNFDLVFITGGKMTFTDPACF